MWYNNGEKEINIDDSNVPVGFSKGRLRRLGSREKEIQNLVDTISKDSLIEFYSTHNAIDTCSEFGIKNRQILHKLCCVYGFKKSKPTMPKTISRTHESYVEGGKKSAQTQKTNWAKKTEEEKLEWSKKISTAINSNPNYKTIKAKQNTLYRNSLTNEEDERQNRMRSQSMKDWWSSLSKEEKQQRINKSFSNGAGYKVGDSGPNLRFKNLLDTEGIEYDREFRIENYSYDFKIGNVLVEINPTITHNSTWTPFNKVTDKFYHRDKSECAKKHGYRCVHVWDWDDCEKIIRTLLNRTKVFARECEIREVSKEDSIKFIDRHHLQGSAKDSIRIGLYFNDELVSIMTFGKPRYNRNYEYELIRYCSTHNVVGGANKIFKYFIDKYNVNSVISYCDNSKFNGNVYTELGFTFKNKSVSKHWYNIKTKIHITDNLLRQQGFDRLFNESFGKGTSNEDLMLSHGFVYLFDAGQSVFTFNKQR